jgi:hypothetical protein
MRAPDKPAWDKPAWNSLATHMPAAYSRSFKDLRSRLEIFVSAPDKLDSFQLGGGKGARVHRTGTAAQADVRVDAAHRLQPSEQRIAAARTGARCRRNARKDCLALFRRRKGTGQPMPGSMVAIKSAAIAAR